MLLMVWVGLFLLPGSTSINLLRQSGERLAGRIACVELAPLDILEAESVNEAFWGHATKERQTAASRVDQILVPTLKLRNNCLSIVKNNSIADKEHYRQSSAL